MTVNLNNSSIHTISFYTLGCKLNQSETDSLQKEFEKRGFTVVPFKEKSDLTIINTCTVTNQADSKDRNIIRQAIKSSPDGKIAVVGCYAQTNPNEVSGIEGVDLILGTKEKFNIFDYITKLKEDNTSPTIQIDSKNTRNIYPETQFETSTTRTRAFLKIQDGCSYFCSYCIIPTARGNTTSRSLDTIIKEAEQLSRKGFKEIVLTGINIGTYAFESYTLFDLIRKLDKVDGLERIRISSIEVNTVSEDMIRFIKNSHKLLPHFHLPLQSGSDRILKAMNRKYTLEQFEKKVLFIRSLIPNVTIGSDLILGFPGESEEHFQETISFIEKMSFSYLHIFRYSLREGTKAALMDNQIPESVKKYRAQTMKQLAKIHKDKYIKSFVGDTESVLWENYSDGILNGLSEHYVRIFSPGKISQLNTISDVKILSYKPGKLSGEII